MNMKHLCMRNLVDKRPNRCRGIMSPMIRQSYENWRRILQQWRRVFGGNSTNTQHGSELVQRSGRPYRPDLPRAHVLGSLIAEMAHDSDTII